MDKEDLLLLLNTSKKSQEIGAQAAALSLVRSVVESLVEKLPTTAPPTPIAPIQDNPSDVVWCNCLRWGLTHNVLNHLEDTTRTMSPSSQSDQVDTKNGPVEHSSNCAHEWKNNLEPATTLHLIGNGIRLLVNWCKKCGALMWSDKILVPDVDTTSSTSVKQDLKESVENSIEESVKSRLRKLIEIFDGLNSFVATKDKDKGYQEGILTAKSVVEMHMRQLDQK